MLSNSKGETKVIGIGFFGLLALLFIYLKLTGQIAWSWWGVLAPLWGPIALVFAFFIVAVLVAVGIQLLKK